MNKLFKATIKATLAAAVLSSVSSGALAQARKNITIEPSNVFPTFNQWVNNVNPPEAPQAFTVTQIQPYAMVMRMFGTTPAATFEPQPVVLGLPELPMAADQAQASRNWGPTLSYQGVRMSLIVVAANGSTREFRPLSGGLKTGERFKIRIVSSFEALANVDQVVGDIWYGQRVGQVYPQAGMSVQMNPGEAVDLPLGANEYFVMDSRGNERFVVGIKHAKSAAPTRSNQPVYRQDAAGSSSYLQLVPQGSFPAVEQVLGYTR
jgi:hypothetical protein